MRCFFPVSITEITQNPFLCGIGKIEKPGGKILFRIVCDMAGNAFSGAAEHAYELCKILLIEGGNVRSGLVENGGIDVAFRKKSPEPPVQKSGGYS